MITFHDLLCLIFRHDWRETADGKERKCLRCPKVQELHGIGIYSHWCDKP